jgi:ABC-type multidrug transport system fused ATPase/permease subunit
LILIVIWGALVEIFISKIWKERQESNDKLYDFSNENFTGIRVIKAFVVV